MYVCMYVWVRARERRKNQVSKRKRSNKKGKRKKGKIEVLLECELEPHFHCIDTSAPKSQHFEAPDIIQK